MSQKDKKDELNVFRLLRISRNLKVKDVADQLEVSTAYINAIENGQRKPSGRLLKDYSQVLGVDAETISLFQKNKEGKSFENFLLYILQKICT